MQTNRHARSERIQQIAELLAVGPHLAVVDRVDALAEGLKRFVAEYHPMRAVSKGFRHQVTFPRIQ